MSRSGYALYTIRFSHYNERARWALDRYQARAFRMAVAFVRP